MLQRCYFLKKRKIIFHGKDSPLTKHFWISITILLSTNTSWGQDGLPTIVAEKFPFKIEASGDRTLPKVVFDDGRVAEIVMEQEKSKFFTEMDITLNSCGKNIPTQCNLVSSYIDAQVKLVWKKHPNPEKIGKPLMRDKREVFSRRSLLTYTGKAKHPVVFKDLQNPVLTCSNWEWLSPKSEKIDLLEWSTENMLTNNETDLSENRTSNAYHGIALTKIDETSYEIGFPTSKDMTILLFDGTVIGWTVKAENFESCDVTIKPNLSTAQTEFQREKKYSTPVAITDDSPFWEQAARQDSIFKVLSVQLLARKHPGLLFLNLIELVNGSLTDNSQTFKISPVSGEIE